VEPTAILLWISLAAAAQQPAIPRPVPGVKPCPNLKHPRTLQLDGRTALEVQVKMDVDVDGAPTAYGPPGTHPLDILAHAMDIPAAGAKPSRVDGFMTEYDGGPPTVQGPSDPAPGYYVSQTGFADLHNRRAEDPRRYVDATKINYVVLGTAATRAGVKLGDFAVVYSCRTGKTAFAIAGDDGNPTGAEGSLALVRALGYNIVNGVDKSVDEREIVIRYVPRSNPRHEFFFTQKALDEAAKKHGLTRQF
jgi:hypothetical protein